MKKFSKLILIVSLIVFSNNYSQQNKVAITIDDLPVAAAGSSSVEVKKQIFKKLIPSLKNVNAPITGFINEMKLYTDDIVDQGKVELVKMWLEAGFDLGNHTYSHKSANTVPVEEFKKDIIDGERVCKNLVKDYGKEYNFFRHPFLNTGRSLEVKKEIDSFLTEKGYTIAPVTFDNSEWIYAAGYEKAVSSNDKALAQKIAVEYIDYMKSKVEWWEKKSSELFGRNINHILLIHANRLNADHVEELIGMIRKKDYEFVSIKEALKDVAYKSEDTFVKAGGISWIDRWAITIGKQKEFFAAEPRAAKWIMDYANIDSE